MRRGALVLALAWACTAPRDPRPSHATVTLQLELEGAAVVARWTATQALAAPEGRLGIEVSCPEREASRSACQPASLAVPLPEGKVRYLKPWPGGAKTVTVTLSLDSGKGPVELASGSLSGTDFDGDGLGDDDCDDSVASAPCGAGSSCVETAEGVVVCDPDECRDANGGCEQTCRNEVGSHACGCREGFVLRADGAGCDDVDECAGATNPCGAGACTNRRGGYACACPAGYTSFDDGRACRDDDECANGASDCAADATCTNTAGGYACTCNEGLAGDGRSCSPIPPGTLFTKTLAGVAFEFSFVPAGAFVMGSPESDPEGRVEERPQHPVTLTRPFLLLRNEVTQAQYQAVLGVNPSTFKGDPSRPAEHVSIVDAAAFCAQLDLLDGAAAGTYAVPTEAQWEYAARAGTTTPQYGPLDDIAWHAGNSGNTSRPVRLKLPNAWQLYDMLGNVFEWTTDGYAAYDAAAQTDPTGPAGGFGHVVRGGSWYTDAPYHRASGYRSFLGPGFHAGDLGFRPRRWVR